jgi:hypothetical protein
MKAIYLQSWGVFRIVRCYRRGDYAGMTRLLQQRRHRIIFQVARLGGAVR